jgi:hypothetical protein
MKSKHFLKFFSLAPVRDAERQYRCYYAAEPGRESPGSAVLRSYSQTADRVGPTRLQRIADPQQKDIRGSRLPCRGAP